MALLFVEHQGQTRGTKLPARVLIGRRSMNHLIIDDPTVSRMHAWIDQRGADFVLTDMRSRTGTRVNGQPLSQRRKLSPGDVIEIGPARLTFQVGDRVPIDIEPFEMPREPVMLARDMGIRFDCPHCRAPMWASTQYAGHGGICTYCGEGFTIPRFVVNPNAKPRATVVSGVAASTAAVEVDEPVVATQPHRPRASIPPPKAPPVPPEYDARLLALQVGAGTIPARDTEPSHHASPSNGNAREIAASLAPKQPQTPVFATPAPTVPEAPPEPPPTQTLAAPPTMESTRDVAAPAIFDAATTFVPAEPDTYTEPPAVAGQYKCGVCHSPILPGELLTACPSCNLKFHAECWQENYGCSAYGCPQVNALAPEPDPSAEPEATAEDATIDIAPPRTPWEFVLLGLSAMGAVVGGFTFGAASLAMLVWSILYFIRSKGDPDRRTGPIVGAIALSAAGVAAGAAVSYFLFLYGRK